MIRIERVENRQVKSRKGGSVLWLLLPVAVIASFVYLQSIDDGERCVDTQQSHQRAEGHGLSDSDVCRDSIRRGGFKKSRSIKGGGVSKSKSRGSR
ncbi:hypothetical protein [Streptomyces sp. NPDC051776]|uniref:hypothetical protein n=1 Tax=Streptomyces sp. NPDC051776 TaxID=3155414 RepID=UPI0034334F8A